ncbi:MAG: PHP domain-containing protein [Candidatus Glassbacteria bacterium]
MRLPFSRQRAAPIHEGIENRTRKYSGGGGAELKADLHVHTGDDPEDKVGYSSFELLDAASDHGFDVISITNHNVITYSEELKNYADGRGILLIPGVERTIGRKHVLIINAEWEDLEVESFGELFTRSGSSKLIIAPHPFFPSSCSLRGDLTSHIGLFNAIEYSHYYTVSMNFNRKAVLLSCQSQKPLIGTSDAHFLHQLGTTYSMVRAHKDVKSIISAVRNGDVRVMSGPLSISHALKIRFSMGLI